jgi:hypothetical protein
MSPRFEASFSTRSVVLRTKEATTRFSYEGALAEAALHAGPESGGRVRVVRPNTAPACQDRPIYGSVSYANLYPGIAVRFDANASGLESEYRIEPGGDPGRIRIRYQGAASRRLNAEGEVEIRLKQGVWRERRPSAWQPGEGGSKDPVGVSWKLNPDGTLGFAMEAYDRGRPLIVDPVISYSTYLSNATAAAFSAATSTAIDSSGNIYVAGWIEGNTLGPTSTGQTVNNGSVDAFVAKLSPTGAVVFITYFGGSGDDRALGLAVDFLNEPWITGSTSSYDLPLRNAFQSSLNGYRNAFIVELNSAGGLLFSSYFGGSGPDQGNAIATDATGNAYVVGDTQSGNFPVRGAAQASYGGAQDAFVAKFSSNGTPQYATFLGGSALDHGTGIAVDINGYAYVTGGTTSSNFPTTSGVFQRALKGSEDAFVAKLNGNGSQILFSTYLGGTGGSLLAPEQGAAIAVDSQYDVYVAGVTPSSDFPVVSPAAQSTYIGSGDGFVTKLNPTASALLASTYLGGTGIDIVTGLAVDHFGAACVVGYTSSVDFPSTYPTQSTFAGLYDSFITILNPSGSGFYYSTYLGGSGIDAANGVAIDTFGNVSVVGQTGSLDLPLLNQLNRSHAGGIDAFAVKIATNDTTSFVERVYFGVNQTAPDSSGFTYWSGQLNQSVQTRAQMALNFFQQTAYQSAGFYVYAAYIAVLGRDPDYGGYNYWTSLFRSGVLATPACLANSTTASCSQLAMLNSFAVSAEFQSRFNAVDNTSFVTVVYVNVLGRGPDSGGLAFWVGSLNAGLTRAQLLQSFINSPEFKSTFGNRIQVGMAYIAFLLRTATATELQTWTTTLNGNGGLVSVLVSALVQSTEFNSGL